MSYIDQQTFPLTKLIKKRHRFIMKDANLNKFMILAKADLTPNINLNAIKIFKTKKKIIHN